MSLDAGRVGVRADQVDIHGRVTSPSFLNELLEDLPEWTDMPVWVNGTEELLPSNNSAPVTSPILADIAYPDIRRDNQYFTYRESPTPVDGLAKIKSIKGNTLVWNQLIQNGNFANTDSWVVRGTGTSFTVSNNVATIKAGMQWGGINQNLISPVDQSHKFLVIADIKGTTDNYISIGGLNAYVTQNNVWQRLYIEMPSAASQWLALTIGDKRSSDWTEYNVKNAKLIDLTLLFGSGNEPTFEEFSSLFPLDYYSYDAGTLLSFNGTGLKTTDKNLLDPSSKTTYDGENGLRWYQSQGFMLMANKTYTFSASNTNGVSVTVYFIDPATRTALASGPLVTTYTPTQNVIVYLQAYRGSGIPSGTEFQLEIGSQTEYEPYTSHTTNLPVSTYFPTGMKSVRTVYDELTPTKAVTRIGAVDLGTLTFSNNGAITGGVQYIATIPGKAYGQTNIVCSKFIVSTSTNNDLWSMRGRDNSGSVVFNTPYATAEEMRTAMSGVYLFYELATPVELPTLSLGE